KADCPPSWTSASASTRTSCAGSPSPTIPSACPRTNRPKPKAPPSPLKMNAPNVPIAMTGRTVPEEEMTDGRAQRKRRQNQAQEDLLLHRKQDQAYRLQGR